MKKRKERLVRNLPLGGKQSRVWEIDLFRGIPIVFVVLYHFCFDITEIAGLVENNRDMLATYPNLGYFADFCQGITYSETIDTVWVPVFGGIFLFVCGLSTALSHNNLRRGALLWLAALLISLGSYALSALFETDLFIGWGILHLMASMIFLYALLEVFARKVLRKEVSPLLCFALGVLLFFAGILLQNGYTLANGSATAAWPSAYLGGGPAAELKKSPWAFLLSALGYYGNMVDWWPILPYGGLIFLGISFGKVLYARKESVLPHLYFKGFAPLCFIGRHTIWIYLLHQPVIIALLALVLSCLGFRFAL